MHVAKLKRGQNITKEPPPPSHHPTDGLIKIKWGIWANGVS